MFRVVARSVIPDVIKRNLKDQMSVFEPRIVLRFLLSPGHPSERIKIRLTWISEDSDNLCSAL